MARKKAHPRAAQGQKRALKVRTRHAKKKKAEARKRSRKKTKEFEIVEKDYQKVPDKIPKVVKTLMAAGLSAYMVARILSFGYANTSRPEFIKHLETLEYKMVKIYETSYEKKSQAIRDVEAIIDYLKQREASGELKENLAEKEALLKTLKKEHEGFLEERKQRVVKKKRTLELIDEYFNYEKTQEYFSRYAKVSGLSPKARVLTEYDKLRSEILFTFDLAKEAVTGGFVNETLRKRLDVFILDRSKLITTINERAKDLILGKANNNKIVRIQEKWVKISLEKSKGKPELIKKQILQLQNYMFEFERQRDVYLSRLLTYKKHLSPEFYGELYLYLKDIDYTLSIVNRQIRVLKARMKK